MQLKNALNNFRYMKMAKRKVNKSQLIRDYFAEHPNEGPTQIARGVSAMGYAVGPAHVNQALGKLRKKRRKKGRGRPATTAATATKRTSRAGAKGVDQLNLAAEFCKSCGGVDSAIEILQSLRSIAAGL